MQVVAVVAVALLAEQVDMAVVELVTDQLE
jgi:hypothetical protein